MNGARITRAVSQWRSRIALSLLLIWGSGCALMSKAAPLSPRYFSPDREDELAPGAASQATSLELRLGRIDAAGHLEQRIAFRENESELGYYDSWRWTEPPEAFLARALSRQLFEQRGFIHVVTGPGPTLDVELIGFEEVRAGAPRARVEIRLALRDDRRTLLERTLRVERPLAPGTAEDAPLRLTRALSGALEAALAQLGELVAAELERGASARSP